MEFLKLIKFSIHFLFSHGYIGKRSLSKLESQPSNMPALAPIGIEAARWTRPESLIEEEAQLLKKYKIVRSAGSNERFYLNDSGYHTQVNSVGVSPDL